MPQEPRTIHIDEAFELARVLSEAGKEPVRVTGGSVSYRVTRDDTLAQSYPAAFDAAIDRLAGSWSVEDAEAAISYIYKAREEGSRPETRP